MAVSETQNPSALKIKFDCGLNDEGKSVIKSRNYKFNPFFDSLLHKLKRFSRYKLN